jgi:adenylate cyclase class 2
MLEIELKFPAADFATIEGHLAKLGAAAEAPIDEADHYFNAPDRDFAKTDEAFRLRSIGAHNRVTYKGPKEPGPAKTRTEIELAIEDGAAAADKWRQLVQRLGYRSTAVVKKRRTIHKFSRDGFHLEACLDEVESIGKFVELEIVADAAQKQRAQEILMAVAREFGLEKIEPRSYLELVLAKRGS